MAVIHPNFYDLNAVRGYPLDGAASGVDDAGRFLPPGLLVDCHLRFPESAGRYACLTAMTTTPGLVTALFACVAPPATVMVPLAAVSLPKPVTAGRPYPIQAMVPGAGGWVVFGPGIEEIYAGRFGTASQGLILPRCARSYRVPSIPSIGKVEVANPLSGDVQLLGSNDVEVVRAQRTIAGMLRDVIVLRLAASLNRTVLDEYTGPCGGRPESDTCPKPGIESLGPVGPDCAGNITINFLGAHVTPWPGGMTVELPLGLAQACGGTPSKLPAADGSLPRAAVSQCAEEPLAVIFEDLSGFEQEAGHAPGHGS